MQGSEYHNALHTLCTADKCVFTFNDTLYGDISTPLVITSLVTSSSIQDDVIKNPEVDCYFLTLLIIKLHIMHGHTSTGDDNQIT